jgi:hypothetical protein
MSRRDKSEGARDERVRAVGGEIGWLKGSAADPADHGVRHIALCERNLWGRREVAIPVTAVASLDGGVRLTITNKLVEELPPLA